MAKKQIKRHNAQPPIPFDLFNAFYCWQLCNINSGDEKIQDKVAVITGAGSGMGSAFK